VFQRFALNVVVFSFILLFSRTVSAVHAWLF